MRTLKKTLALVLVIALALSFGVIGANAAFTDTTDSDYTEAIDVLSGIGVINGMTATTFVPDGSLTRAQAAKIIAYLKLGPSYAQLVSSASSQRFDDVPTTYWAAGYIDYCANLGIIAGVGDNNFDPEGTLSTAAFTKMLLVAVGFDAEENGFVGASWALNVASIAISEDVGIFDEDITISATATCTREQAAQLAYLALFYSPEGSVTKYTVTIGTTVTTFDTLFEAYIYADAHEGDSPVLGTTTDSAGSLAKTVFKLTKQTQADKFGRPGSFYYVTGKTAPIATALATPVATYTAPVASGTIYTAVGLSATATATTVVDGGTPGTFSVVKGDTTLTGGYGTVTEVYYDSVAKTVKIVEVNTYAKTLSGSDIKAAKAATSTTEATPAYIVVEGSPANYEADGAYVTDAFKDGDVILYTKAGAEIMSVELAESFTGKVTAEGSGYFRIDGEKAYWSAASGLDNDDVAYGDMKTFYTDNYGYVIALGSYSDAVSSENYLYVISVEAKAAGTSSLFGDGSAAAAKAKVLDLETGEISVVDIAVVLKDGVYYYATAKGTASSTVVADSTTFMSAGHYYAYTELASGYVFAASPTSTIEVDTAKNVATIASGKYATSTTVLRVIDYATNFASASVTTYTGIANFPTLTDVDALVVAATSGVVSSIIVVRAATTTTAASYAVYKGLGELGAEQAYAFYVNGEVVEYTKAAGVTIGSAGTVYALTVVNDEITVAAQKTTTGDLTSKKILAMDPAYMLLEGGTVVYYADGYVTVDSLNSYVLDTLSVGDYVTVYVNSTSSKAEFVVIGAEPPAA